MTTKCFWVERTGEGELRLRRFVHSGRGNDCPVGGYHDASEAIGPTTLVLDAEGHYGPIPADYVDHADPRWPTVCARCNAYTFTPDDEWQVYQEPFYRSHDGRSWAGHTLPPGAMLDAPWYPWKGADGISLVVVLPSAEFAPDTRSCWWPVDMPTTTEHPDGRRYLDGPGWTRMGDPRSDPPTVSATPSINAGEANDPSHYHGFLSLQDGYTVLTDNIG